MTPAEYCRNKVAPAGSNLYYASLYHTVSERRKLVALFALQRELDEVVYRSSDPGAARVTLHWWFEEVERLFNGAARHPVTRELSGPEHASYLSQRELMGCIAATSQFLDAPESGPYRDWLARHEPAAGYIWSTAGRACGCVDPAQLSVLTRAGACHGAFELLHHLRHFAGLGLNVLPSDLLAEYTLDLETVIRPGADANVKPFFSKLFGQLRDDITTGLDAMEQTGSRAPRFSLTLLKILNALCRKYQRSPHPITRAHQSLTPLGKLWIAWRVRG